MIARLVDERATIYAEPHRAAATVTELAQGDELEISGQTWIEARDSDGNSGFMPSATRLEGATPTARANAAVAVARRNMLVGGLWCGGGLLVTLFTYIAASGGGTYVVAWGAIIFGGWQLLKGISQYMASGNWPTGIGLSPAASPWGWRRGWGLFGGIALHLAPDCGRVSVAP